MVCLNIATFRVHITSVCLYYLNYKARTAVLMEGQEKEGKMICGRSVGLYK